MMGGRPLTDGVGPTVLKERTMKKPHKPSRPIGRRIAAVVVALAASVAALLLGLALASILASAVYGTALASPRDGCSGATRLDPRRFWRPAMCRSVSTSSDSQDRCYSECQSASPPELRTACS